MTETAYSTRRKIALTAIITIFIVTIGCAYQYYYLEERTEYEHAIQLYAVKAHGQKLDAKKLRRLAVIALDRYGPTEVWRIEGDYDVLFEGASGVPR